MHRSNAAQDSKAAETALSLEMQVREELKAQLEQERKSNHQEKEALINQVLSVDPDNADMWYC